MQLGAPPSISGDVPLKAVATCRRLPLSRSSSMTWPQLCVLDPPGSWVSRYNLPCATNISTIAKIGAALELLIDPGAGTAHTVTAVVPSHSTTIGGFVSWV